jgi:hypothetical protein|tara:strand:+ start:162 stop:812 length:651 start_codon:yes stop_codon:yes gene_type:complete
MAIKINIPTSLKDITLRQYKKYLKLEDSVEDERFLNAKMIEIFCSVPLDKVMLLKVKDSTEISGIISDTFEEKPSLVKRFELNGVEYGFQPQLDELTLGEYIDLDTFIGDWDNMEKAMNVLYRPIIVKLKDKYNIDKYVVGNEELLLDMPMDAVLSSIFFLWNLGLDLSKAMTNYLEEGETEALTQYLNSQKNGDGINQFIHSLTEMLDDLKISLN